MASAREIITLQFGNYSNFVGSHFWNIENQTYATEALANQDTDRRVLFRSHPGKYEVPISTPRLIAFDLSGSLGPSKASARVQQEALTAAQSLWGNNLHRVDRGSATPLEETEKACDKCGTPLLASARFCMSCGAKVESAASGRRAGGAEQKEGARKALEWRAREDQAWKQQMERGIDYWPSFLQGPLHSKSVCLLSGLHHGVSPFNYFSQGSEVIATRTEQVEEMLDRLRYFSEECDYLQGVHCLVDVDSGWGGFAASYLSHLRDDFGTNLPVITFGVRPFLPPIQDPDTAEFAAARRMVNSTAALLQLSSLSSMYVPLSAADSALDFAQMKYRTSNNLETSALLALALNTTTTPYRLREDPITMTDFVCRLTPQRSLNMMGLSLSSPVSASDPLFASHSDSRLSQREQALLASASTEKSPVLPLSLKPALPETKVGADWHLGGYTRAREKARPVRTVSKENKLLSKWMVLRGVNEIDETAAARFRSLGLPSQRETCVDRLLRNLDAQSRGVGSVSALLHSVPLPQRFPHQMFPENRSTLPVLSEIFFDQGVHDSLVVQSSAFDFSVKNKDLAAQFGKHSLGVTEWSEFSEQLRALADDSDLSGPN